MHIKNLSDIFLSYKVTPFHAEYTSRKNALESRSCFKTMTRDIAMKFQVVR